MSTQHATLVFHHECNNQAAIDDEFEEDENPLSRLHHQPPILNNNNNDSYFDNKYEDLNTEVYDTRDSENSYVVQLGDPIFDVSYTEEEGEIFNFDPIFDVSDQDDTKKFSTHDLADEDIAETSPIFDVLEEDEMNQVGEKVEDEIFSFNESIYAQETSKLSHEDFPASNGVKNNSDFKKTIIPIQTMSATSGLSQKNFWNNSTSTEEFCVEELKPEHVIVFSERDNDTSTDATKQHENYGVWTKDCHRQFIRKPPDRDKKSEHEHANHVIRHNLFVPTSSGSECAEEDAELLDTRVGILKFKQDQRDEVSMMSLSERYKLENNIIELQKALLCEKEKNMTLEHELNETHKKIRMLNSGSQTLDKILTMGRIEKTTTGLGYQGMSTSSQSIYVRTRLWIL